MGVCPYDCSIQNFFLKFSKLLSCISFQNHLEISWKFSISLNSLRWVADFIFSGNSLSFQKDIKTESKLVFSGTRDFGNQGNPIR